MTYASAHGSSNSQFRSSRRTGAGPLARGGFRAGARRSGRWVDGRRHRRPRRRQPAGVLPTLPRSRRRRRDRGVCGVRHGDRRPQRRRADPHSPSVRLRRSTPFGVPQRRSQCGDATRRHRFPRRTIPRMRRDRRARHAGGDHRRQPLAGGGDPIPRWRVHGGTAVLDGGPRRDRPRRPRQRGPGHRRRATRPDRTYTGISSWGDITHPFHLRRAIAPPSAPWSWR